MNKYRLVWVRCYDCGRSAEREGGCVTVERRNFFGWTPALVTYDRAGQTSAVHFRSEALARSALVDRVVLREFSA